MTSQNNKDKNWKKSAEEWRGLTNIFHQLSLDQQKEIAKMKKTIIKMVEERCKMLKYIDHITSQ